MLNWVIGTNYKNEPVLLEDTLLIGFLAYLEQILNKPLFEIIYVSDSSGLCASRQTK
jgi:hypothetical protein